jgi:hypothetical protein
LPSGNTKIRDSSKISAMSSKMAGAGALRHAKHRAFKKSKNIKKAHALRQFKNIRN